MALTPHYFIRNFKFGLKYLCNMNVHNIIMYSLYNPFGNHTHPDSHT